MTRGAEIRQSRIYLERFEIPFDDIDAGGVLYNAHYLKYCDRARNAIFAKANWTWDRMVANRCVLAEMLFLKNDPSQKYPVSPLRLYAD
ncbi:MAG: acyl-CoA thioesterase [Proteobacteria bacterium]|nr:acyl-CoA thioesterase [Pseudomonadota bacterium]